ncbi:MAG: hypothetical protein PVSMB6_06050 [Steroidobacteraceae bacterium]
MLIGTQAFAGDMQQNHMAKKQMMKECMERMAANHDGSTRHQMKSACRAEMREHMKNSGMSHDEMNKDAMHKGNSMPHEDMDKKPQ